MELTLRPGCHEIIERHDPVHGEATPSRLTALAVLEAAGPLRISDLAARTAIGLPAMSRIVDRLSQYGWVARHPDPTDHRACLISITEAGTELLDAVRRERAGRLAPGLAHLQPQQVTALLVLPVSGTRAARPVGPPARGWPWPAAALGVSPRRAWCTPCRDAIRRSGC
jgi:DNA-binding MarR family transcriptional regulator